MEEKSLAEQEGSYYKEDQKQNSEEVIFYLMMYFDSDPCCSQSKCYEVLAEDIDPNVYGSDGFTPLHLAIKFKQINAINFCIKVNKVALKEGRPEVFDFRLRSKSGHTCFHLACIYGFGKFIDLLIQDRYLTSKLSFKDRDKEGKRPSQYVPFNSQYFKKCKRIEKLSILRFQKKRCGVKSKLISPTVKISDDNSECELEENIFGGSEDSLPQIAAERVLNSMNISGTGWRQGHKPKIESLTCISLPQTVNQTDIPCFDYLIQNKKHNFKQCNDFEENYDSEFVNCKVFIQEFRKNKPMREEILADNISRATLTSGALKISIDKSPQMFSLNKVIDTPSREDCAPDTRIEEGLNFGLVLNDIQNQENISQESTIEEQFCNPSFSTGLIRRMSAKKSSLNISCAGIDYADFASKHQTARNLRPKIFNFKKIKRNFRVKRTEQPKRDVTYEQFEKEMDTLDENEAIAEMQPCVQKYISNNSRSSANLASKVMRFDTDKNTVDLRSQARYNMFLKGQDIGSKWIQRSFTNGNNIRNLLSSGTKDYRYQSLVQQRGVAKPLYVKYRQFFESIDSLNQILTHIDLSIMETKGNLNISIVDMVSLLRRRQDLPKLPKTVVEYIKTQIKFRRYRLDRNTSGYAFRPTNLIFEYLMRELKLSAVECTLRTPSSFKMSSSANLIGPKSISFGCHKVDPRL
ncbi:unnamed protein product [Moneuplotes crassus]|uniref:Uncharacterized protein n=1 Tax=Euplotes crassus TaxID=5936 RepID=A0AAD1X4S4_EUPCR|nr:unnamed protein product [Moneuplotes crassus]